MMWDDGQRRRVIQLMNLYEYMHVRATHCIILYFLCVYVNVPVVEGLRFVLKFTETRSSLEDVELLSIQVIVLEIVRQNLLLYLLGPVQP